MEALAFAATYDKMKDWLPDAVETPVLICGELVHRMNRDTREEEEGIQFLVREAYRLAEGIATFSKCLHVDFRYEDPELANKLKAVRETASSNIGSLPLRINVKYLNGAVVAIELEGGIHPSENLLSDIGKIAENDNWGVDVKSEIFAEPPERRWQRPG